jgi:hypothetical protein
MVNDAAFAEEDQIALEARAAHRWSRVERGELDPSTAMSTMEEWELKIADRRLLLVPSTKDWFWYDSVHDSWESTGHRAGDVIFGVAHGVLVGKVVRGPAPAPPKPQPLPDSTAPMHEIRGSDRAITGQPDSTLARRIFGLGFGLTAAVGILVGAGLGGWLNDFQIPISASSKYTESILGGADGWAFAVAAAVAAGVAVAYASAGLRPRRAAQALLLLGAVVLVGSIAERFTMGGRFGHLVRLGGASPTAIQPDIGIYVLAFAAAVVMRTGSFMARTAPMSPSKRLVQMLSSLAALAAMGLTIWQVSTVHPAVAMATTGCFNATDGFSVADADNTIARDASAHPLLTVALRPRGKATDIVPGRAEARGRSLVA